MPSARFSAITIDSTEMDKKLSRIRKDQFPYAKQLALNNLAFDTVRIERLEARVKFHRPTRWFVNSIQVAKKASKKNLVAAIWIGETVTNLYGKSLFQVAETARSTGVALPHIRGGFRPERKSEKRLKRIGVLKANEYLVGVKTNAAGNVPAAEYVRMLSYFRTFWEAGFSANRASGNATTGGFRYVVGRAGSGRAIYRVKGKGKPKMIWYITKGKPRYKPRFDFYGEARRHAQKFGGYFADKAITKALKTAR